MQPRMKAAELGCRWPAPGLHSLALDAGMRDIPDHASFGAIPDKIPSRLVPLSP